MPDHFKKGGKVQWSSSHGTALRRITSPSAIKSHHVAASKKARQYLSKAKAPAPGWHTGRMP